MPIASAIRIVQALIGSIVLSSKGSNTESGIGLSAADAPMHFDLIPAALVDDSQGLNEAAAAGSPKAPPAREDRGCWSPHLGQEVT